MGAECDTYRERVRAQETTKSSRRRRGRSKLRYKDSVKRFVLCHKLKDIMQVVQETLTLRGVVV